jgi:hypothetical protein
VKRQAGAQRASGGRIAAQVRVEQGEGGAGGEQRIALPYPSVCPGPGRNRRRWRKGFDFRDLRRMGFGSSKPRARRGQAFQRNRKAGGERLEIGVDLHSNLRLGPIRRERGTEIETGVLFSLNLSANFSGLSGESRPLLDCGLPGFDDRV